MKRILSVLIAGAMMMTMMAGCEKAETPTQTPDVPEEPINEYADVKTTDCWGEHSIAVLGDSISFGAGCTDSITDNSYVGILRKAFNEENGSENYGFVSSYPKNWGTPTSEEIHAWPSMTGGPGVVGNASGWAEMDNGEWLIKMGMTAYEKNATITYQLKDGYDYDYFCVYYQTGADFGDFVVTDNGTAKAEVDGGEALIYVGKNDTTETKRTGFFKTADFSNGITIQVASTGNNIAKSKPVTITGIGYYNDISGDMVTFNNYSRGGLMLCEVGDQVLDQVASAGTLIVGVGYNDVFWGYQNGYFAEQFTDRIDYLINACNENGTKVIVNDYIWDNPQTMRNPLQESMYTHCHAELARLAEETGGVYVNPQEVYGDEMIEEVNNGDGVHPTDAGHAMMAQAILDAIGLGEGDAE